MIFITLILGLPVFLITFGLVFLFMEVKMRVKNGKHKIK